MFLPLSIFLIAFATLIFLPSKKLKVLFGIYFLLLYFFMSGIDGLIATETGDYFSEYLILAFYTFILLMHLPLIFYLFKMNHKTPLIKKAREVFDKEVMHLGDKELYQHLKHPG